MDCMNCTADIPPQWVACIQENKCPSCGGQIMDEHAKSLLDELRKAIEKMPNNPEGLAGWILSNYKLYKIGDAAPTEFYQVRQDQTQTQPQPQPQPQPQSVLQSKSVVENPVHKFLQRTGVAKQISERKDLKDIINEINDGAVSKLSRPNALHEFYNTNFDPDIDLDYMQNQDDTSSVDMINSVNTLKNTGNVQPLSQEELEAMKQVVATADSDITSNSNIEGQQLQRINKLKNQVVSSNGRPSFRKIGK